MATVAIGSVEGVERLAGIDFPESARLVNPQMRAALIDQDPMAWAIIDMPRAEARALLTRSPFSASSTDDRFVTDDWGPFGGDPTGTWHPDAADKWLSGSVGESRPEYWNANALADLGREPARVYLLLMR